MAFLGVRLRPGWYYFLSENQYRRHIARDIGYHQAHSLRNGVNKRGTDSERLQECHRHSPQEIKLVRQIYSV